MSSLKKATPEHPIQELLARRWSPYAFSDRPVSDDDLRSLFEATRWAASSYNEQPWTYLVATKADPAEFARLLSCLVEANQAWAKAAPVLALGCTSLRFAFNGKPNAAAIHDLGLASASLTLEATARGLCVHQMIGILPDRARELYQIPEGVQPLTGLAIGYEGDPQTLPEKIRERDLAPRTRKRLAEFVFRGKWGAAAGVAKWAPQAASQRTKMHGRSRLPLGFKDHAQLAAFKADLEELIDKTRVDGKPITALVQVTGASTAFYSDNPDTPDGHHWDASGRGLSDYDIDLFSPELAGALLDNPKAAGNEEVLAGGKRVFFRNGGEAGLYQVFPQFESLVRQWEQELGRAIELRLRLDVTPVAQLSDPPAMGPGPILLLRRP